MRVRKPHRARIADAHDDELDGDQYRDDPADRRDKSRAELRRVSGDIADPADQLVEHVWKKQGLDDPAEAIVAEPPPIDVIPSPDSKGAGIPIAVTRLNHSP